MAKNQQYFFILGNNVNLSMAELIACLEKWERKYEVVAYIDEVLILNISDFTDEQFLQLGGCKKYGKVNERLESVDAKVIAGLLLEQAEEPRFNFGFSLYGLKSSESKRMSQSLFKQGLIVKKELKTKNIKSRLVQSKQQELSSVAVDKEKMIEHGCDLNIVKIDESYYIGKTLAVQDYHAFSQRDYGRPKRDARSGMLPPKLARIMLNLSKGGEGDVLLDPFCGSGTVIMEALILGWEKIFGSDKSEMAIDNTHQNLMWLQQKMSFSDMPLLEVRSVTEIDKSFDEQSIDHIVAEPYLGPPLRSKVSRHDIENIIYELTELYTIAYKHFAKILKPGGRVVMIWPMFVLNKEVIQLDISRVVGEIGFTKVEYLSKFSLGNNKLVYQRPDQLVRRRIEIWQLN
jgi:tRNA G10  N-methylase Trm11